MCIKWCVWLCRNADINANICSLVANSQQLASNKEATVVLLLHLVMIWRDRKEIYIYIYDIETNHKHNHPPKVFRGESEWHMDDMPIQEKSESPALHFFHVVRSSRTDPTMLLSLGQMVPWCHTSEAAARHSQGVQYIYSVYTMTWAVLSLHSQLRKTGLLWSSAPKLLMKVGKCFDRTPGGSIKPSDALSESRIIWMCEIFNDKQPLCLPGSTVLQA